MKYLGNFADWIQPGLLDRLINTKGKPTLLNQPKTWVGHPEHEAWYKSFCEAGYDKRNFYSNMYDEDTEDLKDFNITCPFDIGEDHEWFWWFIKFKPGSVACMHYDPHTKIIPNIKRYWFALQDYHPGHLFIYDGKMMKNYKAGDLYEFDRADLYHGATNISMIDRVTFQFTVYKNEDYNYDKKDPYTDLNQK